VNDGGPAHTGAAVSSSTDDEGKISIMDTTNNVIPISEAINSEEISIPKPGPLSLDMFRSKLPPSIGGVATLQPGLPVHSLAAAKDFARLHADERKYGSPELCFVNVPIPGQKRDTVHLITEELAQRFLPADVVKRHRLALASKPFDVFFLCTVPSQNLENDWNASNAKACEQAKTLWTKATSRRTEGVDGYHITKAQDPDAFPEPRWPAQSLEELILLAFEGRTIDREDHPALLRLLGKKPDLS
jgi:hypothetical protein